MTTHTYNQRGPTSVTLTVIDDSGLHRTQIRRAGGAGGVGAGDRGGRGADGPAADYLTDA